MKETQTNGITEAELFYRVPAKEWEVIKTLLEKVSQPALPPEKITLGDWMLEKDAKALLGGKSTTWFWYARRGEKKINGVLKKLPYKLAFAKVGSKVFYRKADLLNILDESIVGKEAANE